MTTKLFAAFFTLSSIAVFAQQLMGRLVRDDGLAAGGVQVVNLRTGFSVYSNAYGDFSIAAKPGDELRAVSRLYERYSKILTASDFSSRFTVVLTPAVTEIDEVVIKFRPTGNLKQDIKQLPSNARTLALNNEVGSQMRLGKEYEYLPKLEVPSMFSGPDLSAGQVNIFGLIKAGYRLLNPKTSAEERFAPNEYQTEEFLARLKNDLDDDYFKSIGLSPGERDEFVEYATVRLRLVSSYYKNYSLPKIIVELEGIVEAYKKRG